MLERRVQGACASLAGFEAADAQAWEDMYRTWIPVGRTSYRPCSRRCRSAPGSGGKSGGLGLARKLALQYGLGEEEFAGGGRLLLAGDALHAEPGLRRLRGAVGSADV
ncbi:dehydrogenase [Streptomyces avidinii]